MVIANLHTVPLKFLKPQSIVLSSRTANQHTQLIHTYSTDLEQELTKGLESTGRT